jgi:hypothetical protein
MRDAIFHGEFVFPAGGVGGWTEEVGALLRSLQAFDDSATSDLVRVLVSDDGVAIRGYLAGGTFHSWCPRLLTMLAKAARRGASGDVTFVPIGDGPAYRCTLAYGKAHVDRIAATMSDDPTVVEIVAAAAAKEERRSFSDLETAFLARSERRSRDR